MKKFLFFLMGIAMSMPLVKAQEIPPDKIRPLTVGDTVPDITFNNIINYKETTASLSDFVGGLVILDFFATSCGPCLKEISRFARLQKEYGDKIRIILVTTETEERIMEFIGSNNTPSAQALRMFPIITEGSYLRSYFPYRIISHDVWIDKNYIVKAITLPEYITSDNISAVIRNSPVYLPLKQDILNFDYQQPLLTLNDTGFPLAEKSKTVYYSSCLPHLDNVHRGIGMVTDSGSGTTRVFMINLPIVEMYLNVFNRPTTFSPSRIIINDRDAAHFFISASTGYKYEWKKNNTYCYDAVFPATLSLEEINKKIKLDLDFYFGLNTSLKIREIECLMLIKKTLETKPFAKRLSSDTIPGKNINIKTLLYYLNLAQRGRPVIDVSGLPEDHLITLHVTDLTNIEAVEKEMGRYGLFLTPEIRDEEMLTLLY